MAIEDKLIEMLASPYFGARARAALRTSLNEWVEEEGNEGGGGGGAGGGLYAIKVCDGAVPASNELGTITQHTLCITENSGASDPYHILKLNDTGHTVGAKLVIVRSADNSTGSMIAATYDGGGNLIGPIAGVQEADGNYDTVTLIYTGTTYGWFKLGKLIDG